MLHIANSVHCRDISRASRRRFYHYGVSDETNELADEEGFTMAIDQRVAAKDILEMLRSNDAATLWVDYDREADALYLNFERPQHADDSEMSDDGVVTRYRDNRVVGYTILNAGEVLLSE